MLLDTVLCAHRCTSVFNRAKCEFWGRRSHSKFSVLRQNSVSEAEIKGLRKAINSSFFSGGSSLRCLCSAWFHVFLSLWLSFSAVQCSRTNIGVIGWQILRFPILLQRPMPELWLWTLRAMKHYPSNVKPCGSNGSRWRLGVSPLGTAHTIQSVCAHWKFLPSHASCYTGKPKAVDDRKKCQNRAWHRQKQLFHQCVLFTWVWRFRRTQLFSCAQTQAIFSWPSSNDYLSLRYNRVTDHDVSNPVGACDDEKIEILMH